MDDRLLTDKSKRVFECHFFIPHLGPLVDYMMFSDYPPAEIKIPVFVPLRVAMMPVAPVKPTTPMMIFERGDAFPPNINGTIVIRYILRDIQDLKSVKAVIEDAKTELDKYLCTDDSGHYGLTTDFEPEQFWQQFKERVK